MRGHLSVVGTLGAVASVVNAQRLHPEYVGFRQSGESSPVIETVNGNEERTLTEAEDSTADDRVTTPMPNLDDKIDLVHHAGRISLDSSKRNNIFYWHFAAASNPESAPLVIWLNGGPGCSSMQGLFMGVSPFQIEKGAKLSINEHSWYNNANLLFIDQPVGTGMSYTRGNDYRTDEQTVAKDFHNVLSQFFQRHPEYVTTPSSSKIKRTRDLYIFGESHAGRFIPEFSDYIVSQNKVVAADGGLHINLVGVGIGNGWVHPYIQYDYTDFAHGMGFITYGQVRSLKAQFVECQNALLSENYLTAGCFANMNKILDGLINRKVQGSKSLNFYDVRHYVHSVGNYPARRADIGDYLNQLEVRKMLHANNEDNFSFRDCSDGVYDGLRAFDGVSTLKIVERLLKGGTRVLFYNGQWDMMCNHYSTEKLLLHLDWQGAAAYQDAQKYTWSVKGRNDPAGFAQQGGNLTFTVIAGAGHMVPMDVPDVAAEMVKRFINNQPFDDSAQSVQTVRTNSTNLETVVCPIEARAVAGNSVDLTWLWVSVVVAVVGSLLVFCVSIMCRRSRKARHSEHSIIEQESDEEDETDRGRGKVKVKQARHDSDDDEDNERVEISVRARSPTSD